MAQGKKGAIDQDIKISLRINSSLHEIIKEIADKHGIKLSEAIRRVLIAEIEKNISQK